MKAIIFDMDGVFVDTEQLVFPVFRRTFEPLGIDLSDEYQYRFIGKPFSSNLAEIRRDFDIDFSDDHIVQQFERHYERIITSQLTDVQKGVAELMSAGRKRGLSFGLCTTSSRHHVNIVLDIVNRQRKNGELKLDALVCGDDVTHRKPHPEPYLMACSQLQMAPADTLVFEDTATGLAAAKAAGCRAVALRKPYNRHHDFSQADHIINSMHEALSLLE